VDIHENAFSFVCQRWRPAKRAAYAGIQAVRRAGTCSRTDCSCASILELARTVEPGYFCSKPLRQNLPYRTQFSPTATVVIWTPLVLSFVWIRAISAESPVARTGIVPRWYQLCVPPALGSATGTGWTISAPPIRCARRHAFPRGDPVLCPPSDRGALSFSPWTSGFVRRILRSNLRASDSLRTVRAGQCRDAARWNKFDLDPLGASHIAPGLSTTLSRLLVFTIRSGLDRPFSVSRNSPRPGCKKGDFSWRWPSREDGIVDAVFYAGELLRQRLNNK